MDDDRSPIVYFRSFSIDESSDFSLFLSLKQLYKEQIVAASYFDEGPFVAIGKPDEIAPELGAARVYVDEDIWEEVAKIFIDEAGIIIFRISRIGLTKNLQYEINQCIELNAKRKLHLIFFGREYSYLKQEIQEIFKAALPKNKYHRRAVLCFESEENLQWSDRYRLRMRPQSGNVLMKSRLEDREYTDMISMNYSFMSDEELNELNVDNLTEEAEQIREQEIDRRMQRSANKYSS